MKRHTSMLALVLSMLAFCFGLLATSPASQGEPQSEGKVAVVLTLEASQVKAGDPIRGTVEVNLSAFEDPQEVLVVASLIGDEGGGFEQSPFFAVRLRDRSNGVHRVSLHGDLGCFADVERPGRHKIHVSASTSSKSASSESMLIFVDDTAFPRRFRQPHLDNLSAFVTEFPRETPVKVELDLGFLSRGNPERTSVDIVQKARITGASEIPLKGINHNIVSFDKDQSVSSEWTVVFPKPGQYRLEFELTGDGFKPLKGHLSIMVRDRGQASKLSVSCDAEKIPSGKPLGFSASYETTELVTISDSQFLESLIIDGPEKLKVERTRFIPVTGLVTVDLAYQAILFKPGVYKWKMTVRAAAQNPPIVRSGAVTVVAADVPGRAGWTRTKAILQESNNAALTGGAGTAQWRYKDARGAEAVSVITWSTPPSSLSDGAEFELALTASPWTAVGQEMPKGLPEFNASYFLSACLPVDGPGNRCSVTTRSGALTSKVKFRFSSRLAGDKPVTIVLAVNPAFKDITLSETWAYNKGGGAPSGVGSLVETGDAKIARQDLPQVPRPRVPGAKESASAKKASEEILLRLDAVLGGFRFGWKDGVPVITELLYPDIAESLSIKLGDPIAELNGKKIEDIPPNEVTKLLGRDGARPLTIKIRRADGVLVTIGVGR